MKTFLSFRFPLMFLLAMLSFVSCAPRHDIVSQSNLMHSEPELESLLDVDAFYVDELFFFREEGKNYVYDKESQCALPLVFDMSPSDLIGKRINGSFFTQVIRHASYVPLLSIVDEKFKQQDGMHYPFSGMVFLNKEKLMFVHVMQVSAFDEFGNGKMVIPLKIEISKGWEKIISRKQSKKIREYFNSDPNDTMFHIDDRGRGVVEPLNPIYLGRIGMFPGMFPK
jgi:hypothetical protein